jgi:protein-arginine kinase activator protein McsA
MKNLVIQAFDAVIQREVDEQAEVRDEIKQLGEQDERSRTK